MYDTEYRTIKVRDDVWAIETDLVRSFVITGATAALSIDTGVGDFDYLKAVRGITSLPLMVVNTHCHDDHCGGDKYFAQVYIHPGEEENLRQFEEMNNVKSIFVEDGYVFDLGDHNCRVLNAFGHSQGHIAILDEKNRFLFTGDMVGANPVIMTNDQGRYSNEDYLAAAKYLYGLRDRFDCIYPCHGDMPLDNEYLKELGECVAGIMEGSIPLEDYTFRPCKIIPGIHGLRGVSGRVSMLYYEPFGDRYVKP